MDTVLIISCAIIGFLFNLVIAVNAPALENSHRFIVAMIGMFLGLAVGCWMMWTNQEEE